MKYSTCGRIPCFGIRTPGWAMACMNCGNTQVVFQTAPVAAKAAVKVAA